MHLKTLHWEKYLCKYCENCVHFCSGKRLQLEEKELKQEEGCTKCRLCVKYCPEGCLELE